MTALRLGLADLRHEPLVALCQVLALAAVLAPLLVLWGLKHGVINALLDDLRRDPAVRQVMVGGARTLSPVELELIRARPEVGFAIPMPRSFGRESYLAPLGGGLVPVSLLPSGPGDPLVPNGHAPSARGEVALAPELAKRLGVTAGAALESSNERGALIGRTEELSIRLTVVQVLGPGLIGPGTALIDPEDLDTVEAFLDGFALPERGVDEGKPLASRPAVFESLRLYARDIGDVAPLAAWLAGSPLGLQVTSRLAEIERLQALDRNLATVFALLVALSATGYLVALAATLWGNVQRKRRVLSVVRLLGARRGSLMGFPLVQAASVALLGALVAVGLSAAAAALINARFAGEFGSGRTLCAIAPAVQLVAGLLSLVAALVAGLAGGLRAMRIDPTEGFRDA